MIAFRSKELDALLSEPNYARFLDAAKNCRRSPAAETLPRIFGSHELLELVGEGGMGRVYKAKHIATQRIVALKMIRPDLVPLHDPSAGNIAERFLVECRAAASLEHDNVIRVYDAGQFDRQLFYSMQYVEGQTLSRLVRDSPLGNYRAAEIVMQASIGIQHAHDKGVLHRDVKPANVLIDEQSGAAAVTDFGLAKQGDSTEALTRTGVILGSVAYMSPEQARDATTVGFASDVYSLGAVLYRCLAGQPPHTAATTVEMVHKVTSASVTDVRRLRPSVPADLANITMKCLQPDPNDRYQSAADLAKDLRRFLDGQPVLARPLGSVVRLIRTIRRQPVRSMLILMAALSIPLLWLAILQSGRAADTQLNERVRRILTVRGVSLDQAIEDLKPQREAAIERLLSVASGNLTQPECFRVGCALCELGCPRTDLVFAGNVHLNPDELANVCDAIRAIGDQEAIINVPITSAEQGPHAALIMALCGNWTSFNQIAAESSDPAPRLTLTDQIQERCSDSDICWLAKSAPTGDSAYVVALAAWYRTKVEGSLGNLVGAMKELYHHPDAGAHSAAAAVLVAASCDLPRGAKVPEAGWLRELDFTLVHVRAGELTVEARHMCVRSDYLISDREVTNELFARYESDRNTLHGPQRRTGAVSFSPFADGPVSMVHWSDAIAFCNWLSNEAGLEPCYEPTDYQGDRVIGWNWIRDRNGYRLPTAAEWEYAARAGSKTATFLGDNRLHASDYARLLNTEQRGSTSVAASDIQAIPVASLLPNRFGLFDVLGNVAEWVWDPAGMGHRNLAFGGSLAGGFSGRISLQGEPVPPVGVPKFIGFRVVRSATNKSE